MNLDFPEAFDPIVSEGITVTCVRRTNGTINEVTATVLAAIIPGGDPADGGGKARVTGAQYSVTVKDAGWPTPSGPAFGDKIEHEVYGTMTVQSVQRDGVFWNCQAVAKMGAHAT